MADIEAVKAMLTNAINDSISIGPHVDLYFDYEEPLVDYETVIHVSKLANIVLDYFATEHRKQTLPGLFHTENNGLLKR